MLSLSVYFDTCPCPGERKRACELVSTQYKAGTPQRMWGVSCGFGLGVAELGAEVARAERPRGVEGRGTWGLSPHSR